MFGEVEKILVLSTSHMPSSTPDFGAVRHVEHDYGYIVFVMSVDEDANVPMWLAKLLNIARGQRCPYLDFDADGPVDGNLPTWEW